VGLAATAGDCGAAGTGGVVAWAVDSEMNEDKISNSVSFFMRHSFFTIIYNNYSSKRSFSPHFTAF